MYHKNKFNPLILKAMDSVTLTKEQVEMVVNSYLNGKDSVCLEDIELEVYAEDDCISGWRYEYAIDDDVEVEIDEESQALYRELLGCSTH